MKSLISLGSAMNVISMQKHTFSIIQLTAKNLKCRRTYHIGNTTRIQPAIAERNTNKKPSKSNRVVSEDRHIIFDSYNNDADVFGTFSEDYKVTKQLEEMPDEDDYVVEKEFIDGKEGKTRISICQYAFIMKQFIKQHKIGNAIEVLETRMLKNDRVQPDNYIYNILIAACGSVGFTKKAFNLYNDMKKRGLKVTPHTYTSLFNACASSPWPHDGLKRARNLRSLMWEKQYIPNVTNYHAMIKAFGRCGDLETAFSLVDEMVSNKVLVNEVTFNFLLQACITDKEAGFRHALLVWRKMLEKEVQPTLFTYNLMLRACRDSGFGNLEATKQVIQDVIQSGVDEQSQNQRKMIGSNSNSNQLSQQYVIGTPNLLATQPHLGSVSALENIVQPEHRLMLMGGAVGIFQQMKNHKVRPDVKTFTQLLDLIPSTLEAEEALLKESVNHKLKLDIDFCNMLMKKRCIRFDYTNAQAVLKLIQLLDLQPDIVTFGVLAMTCQTINEADSLIKDINDNGFRVNMEIMGTFLHNASHQKNIAYTKEIMQRVVEESLKPNNQFMKCVEKFYNQVNKSLDSRKNLKGNNTLANPRKKQALEFCIYYRTWCKQVEPEVLPHPYKQFEKHTTPEDEEFLRTGKLKQ